MTRKGKAQPVEWISRQEVAEIFGVNVRTVDRWALEGRITRHKKPASRIIYYDKSEVELIATPVPIDEAATG